MTAPKWLTGYAVGVTAALGATFLMGLAAEKTAFEEIDVQRINVVEPDGTLRMTISNQTSFPELIFHGEEHKHPGRDTAGILFFNEEGTENGGLTFSGHRDEDGVEHTTGHLSFDQYDQDQVFRIFHYQTGEATTAGMEVSDRPMKSLDLDLVNRLSAAKTDEERKALTEEAVASGSFGNAPRVFIGKTRERASQLSLKDGQGRERIVLEVTEDGQASVAFLDENGDVQRRLTPEAD